MARPEKVAVVDEVKDGMSASAATLLTNYRGLTVSELAQLRAELRKAKASYRVAKNTLTRIAAREAGLDGLDEMLVGPTALVFCEEDPVGPAKALRDFAKDHPALEVKGGYLDGEVLDAGAALKLAELESREELLAKLAGLMYGALANTARLLKAPIEKQARLVQALIDAGGYAGADAVAEDAPAAPEVVEEPAAEAPAADATDATEDAPAADAEVTDEAPTAEADAEATAGDDD